MKSSAWSRSSLIICFLLALSLGGLFAQQAHTQNGFSQAQVQAVLQAEASLNRISTAAGRFLQISNEGGIARGDFSCLGQVAFALTTTRPAQLH